MSLTSCLKRAGSAIHPEDKTAILANAQALRKQEGVTTAQAAMRAVDERIAFVQVLIENPPVVEAAAEPVAAADAAPAGPTPNQLETMNRETQRDLFNQLSTSADMIGKTADEIYSEIQARWPANMRFEAEAASKLAQAVRQAVAKNKLELEKQRFRDPAVLAGAVATAAEDLEPDSKANFMIGFQHALAGKTKSTMHGEDLPVRMKGYDAARGWMKTPEGAAWYEGRPVNKLTNTGVDLRRHWELMQSQMKANESDTAKAWAQIQRATNRADLFAPLMPEGSPPGVVLYFTEIRSGVRTFQQWLEKINNFGGNSTFKGSKKTDMEYLLDGERYPVGLTEEDHERFESEPMYRAQWLRDQAAAYLKAVEPFLSTFDGAASVKDAAERFDAKYIMTTPPKNAGFWSAWLNEAGVLLGRRIWNKHSAYMGRLRSTSDWTQNLIEKEAVIELPKRADALTPPRLDSVTRTGTDYRKGANITPEQFKAEFGLADVGFGKWVGSKQDQDHLNYAYDAFRDLAKQIGMDPNDMGFGGQLHFTIGALGHGKFAAHFQSEHPSPDGKVQVINLTNTKGDGTVGHEWFHALDHNLGGEWGSVRNRVLSILKKAPYYSAEAVDARARDFLFGGWYYKGQKREGKVAAAMQGISQPRGASAYKANADKLGKDYWGNDAELFARASEAWMADTMGATNTYLVNPAWVGDGAVTPAKGHRGTPYPTGEERRLFNLAFTALTKAIKVVDGKPTVTLADFNRLLPDEFSAARERIAYLSVASNMQTFYAEEQAKMAAKASTDEQDKLAAKRREQAELDELAAKQLLELQPVVDPAPVSETSGPLDRGDLEALFDEAAAELREGAQEQPDVPAPGMAAEPKKRTTKAEREIAERTSQLANYFAPGNIVKSYGGQDEVLSFQPSTASRDWSATVRAVVKSGEKWVADPRDNRNRTHTTLPSKADFAAGPLLRAEPAGKAAQAAPDATELISKAAAMGVKGAAEALTGLAKLFGGSKGGRLNSFGAGFDEETYKQAKPHFEAALKAFQEAGKSLKDLFKLLIQQFGDGVKEYAVRFAEDQKLTAQLGEQQQVSASMNVADRVAQRLAAGHALDWRTLFAMADDAFGGTQADGKYTPKDAYDAMEAGVNRYLMRDNGRSFNPNAPRDVALMTNAALERVTALLPTQTKRTAEQDEFQQFSTVPAFAHAAVWAANVTDADVMLEPSAGVGGLAVFARNAGAKLVLNELSSRRAAVLQDVFPGARVFHENAEQLDNILPDDVKPTVVVMNPPFSSSAGRQEGTRDTQIGAQHIEQALNRLVPGGRLVAISGQGMAMDKPAFKAWWAKIGAKYDVLAVIPVDGAGYAKYGTTFDNVLIVIDKIKPVEGREIVTTKANTYADLIGLTSGVRDERPATQLPANDRGGAERDAAEQQRDQAPDRSETTTAAGPGTGAPAGVGSGEGSGQRSGVDAGGARRDTAGRAGRPAGDVLEPGNTQARNGADAGSSSNAGTEPSGGPGAARDTTGVVVGSDDQVAAALTDSVFEDYKPQRLVVAGAKPHPGALVQSAAMASVLPPTPTYTPNLPKATIIEGKLSLAQIEAVVYAGQAHSQVLEQKTEAATLKGMGLEGKGVREGVPYRRGFFIGDNTGVGKGREIGGIILDNLRQGRKKAVWISEKQPLMEDAKRDFKAVGGDEGLVFNQNKTGIDGTIEVGNGVLYTTYHTLKMSAKAAPAAAGSTASAAKTASRIDQLVKWLGPDFDGVIAFDEAHNAGAGIAIKGDRGFSTPSQAATAVIELQNRLPNARVVYVSATGATEVSNLSFATRLGLWGPGTPFPDVHSFVNQMASGGLATMELVARDMKQMGAYMARSLSYDGVTYSTVEHELTSIQRDIYNTLAQAWQTTLKNINEALKETGATSAAGKPKGNKAKANVMSVYWGQQQRFFNQVITSMQMPSVIEAIERDIANGDAVVLQLVNTNEAQQERALAKRSEEDEGNDSDLEDMDISPLDQLLSMVEKSFPTQQFHDETRDDGSTISVPVLDSNGTPVQNKAAVAMKNALLADLKEIKVPDGPLDLIVNAFGPKAVAEVTGRKQRLVRQADKEGVSKTVLERRGGPAARADAAAFMADKKQILVFSDAGGTGFSFHADLTKPNQRKRRHYLIQPGWRANKAIQGFGRTHRTNEASQPEYRLARTDIPAQRRFISSIARRLDQLGALTTGQRNTSSQGLFSEKDNLESKYATQAVKQLILDVKAGAIPEINFKELLAEFGLQDIVDPQTGQIPESKYPPTRQFLNRLLSLSLERQEKVFEEFGKRIDEKVEKAIQDGTLDTGMQTIRALKSEVKRDETIYTDPRTGAQTRYVELELTQPVHIEPFPEASFERSLKDKTPGQFVLNKRSGRVWLKQRLGTSTAKSGAVVNRYWMRGTSGGQTRDEGDVGGDKFSNLTLDEARTLWAEEVAKKPTTYTERSHMIVGAMLPIWDRLQTDGILRVARTQTIDGQRLLGRVVDKADLDDILKRLNIDSAVKKMKPAEILARVLLGDTAKLANGWELKRVKVSDDARVEIIGAAYLSAAAERELIANGAFKERISWKDRYFLPTGAKGAEALDNIAKSKPVVELNSPKEEEGDAGGGVSLSLAARVDAMRAPSAERLDPRTATFEDQQAVHALEQAMAQAYPGVKMVAAGRPQGSETYISSLNDARTAVVSAISAYSADRISRGLANDEISEPASSDTIDVPMLKIDQRVVRNTLSDMLGSAGSKVSWIDKTFSTQYAKAQRMPEFGKVFYHVQRYLEDTSTFANEAADLAPGILPQLRTLSDANPLKKFGLSDIDARAVAGPIFEGTLNAKKVFNDAELKSRFNLNPAQIDQYRQFLATVNESLDQVVAAEVLRLMGTDVQPGMREMALNDRMALRSATMGHLSRLADEGDTQAEKKMADIGERYARSEKLKDEGYAPLMRFGRYFVNIESNTPAEDGGWPESLFFGMYESKAAANKAARELSEDPEFEGHTIKQGVMSQEQFKLFADVPLESMEMFAAAVGAEKSELYQDFLRLTKNNRSALKRLIHRKGTAGFSEDVPRVLAAFTTSNARMAAGAMNLTPARDAARTIREGDVKDEAIKLIEAVQSPADTAAGVRSLMFMNFLGGSVASALVNMTQPITMTLPYLSQWGGIVKASARLMAAGKDAATGVIADKELSKALKQAEDDGIVSPQEIHHLTSQAMATFSSHPALQRVAFIWSAPFSLAERFNRRVSFIAAYRTAVAEKIENPFEFAKKAVIETQGLYNRGNAPNLSRNAVGAAALTFKQFSIHYLEWMARMYRSGPEGKRAVLYALALLMVAGGAEGLPFAEDANDLVDTLTQALGYDASAKSMKRDFLSKTLGMDDLTTDVVMRGLSALPGMPMDLSIRMGMGNLVPATGLFLRSNTDRSRDVLEIAGPTGALAQQGMTGIEKALEGDVTGGIAAAMPIALQNVAKAAKMWETGEYRDAKDRRVMDTDTLDGVMKFLGFQPAAVARKSGQINEVMRSVQLAKNVEVEIADAWARGINDRDQEAVTAARSKLADWNADNPEAPIVISNSQIVGRLRALRATKEDRFLKTVPRELRPGVREAIQ